MFPPVIVPYGVKNPAKRFPYATIAIIALNVLIYALTTERGLAIRLDVLDRWAMRWGESPPITVFTAMFLHAGPLHLVGNMLFLWVFGPAVEDRMRIGRYLALYFFAGFAAFAAEAALGSATAAGITVPTIGASGCIMGVVGAYWYLYSWSPVRVFFWCLFTIIGTCEVAAFWVIGFFFALDLINGMIARQCGLMVSVANFAHVGGAFAGAVMVWALRFQRDSKEISQIRAAQADCGNIESLTCDELAKLVQSSPDDEELLIAYTRKAWEWTEEPHMRAALLRNPRAVILTLPSAVVDYLVVLNGSPTILTTGDLIHLARHCERSGQPERALRVYEITEWAYPGSPDIELALYRGAMVCLEALGDAGRAEDKLRRLIAQFPAGDHVLEAEDVLRSLDSRPSSQAA